MILYPGKRIYESMICTGNLSPLFELDLFGFIIHSFQRLNLTVYRSMTSKIQDILVPRFIILPFLLYCKNMESQYLNKFSLADRTLSVFIY